MREAPTRNVICCIRPAYDDVRAHVHHLCTRTVRVTVDDTDGPSIQTDHRYRRFRSLLRLYRVSIDRLYRRSIEYRDVCIEYRRAGLGLCIG